MEFVIRKAVPEDALGIEIVRIYTWKTTYSGLMPDELIDMQVDNLAKKWQGRREGLKTNDNMFVAVVDHTIVGLSGYCPSRNPAYPESGEISGLYCLKGFQGYGIGKALFKAAAEALVKDGYQSMVINCLRGNPALEFYKHMGGSVVGEIKDERSYGVLIEDVLFYDEIETLIQ